MKLEVQAIVFDLFHTLVDPEDFRPKDFRRADVAAEITGLDKDQFATYWKDSWKLRMSSSKPEIEYLKEYALKSGVSPSQSSFDEADRALRRYQDIAILNPREEVIDSLRSLKQEGYKLGLLSNTFEGDVRQWNRSRLAPCFDAVAFSHEIGIVKPEQGAFNIILERLGVSGSHSIFVGDGGSEELIGAKRAGFARAVFMRRFVLTNGMRTKEELEEIAKYADASADTFEELPSIIVHMQNGF
ncbi:MAG: HAD family hydrolase [Thaumarchaeota archaeon]|nr:HAD family hydrolase [Nitrososphaerota archaeon]